MDSYFFAKWLHIVSATVLFGTGLGTAVHLWLAHRSGEVRAIAVATRNTVTVDWWFTGISGLLQPVTGLWLIHLAGHDWTASWLLATYALFAIAGACWLIVVYLQIRARDLAAAAITDGSELPPDYHRAMRLWFALGWPAFLALAAVFWLMVAKPALW